MTNPKRSPILSHGFRAVLGPSLRRFTPRGCGLCGFVAKEAGNQPFNSAPLASHRSRGMPARSTPFQKLVHHIQAQLAEGHSVQESAMLRHRLTGEEREVDVVIRSAVGEHPIVVSIECIDRKRRADSTWVEQMKAMHEHLETDRLVLVSRSGFYKPALSLAASLGIATYTPDEATPPGLDQTRRPGSDLCRPLQLHTDDRVVADRHGPGPATIRG